ncbi:MAG: DUF4287 domain-containing protein [Chloroflexi bacterium]|nr:DUF4287 domain-containing protein [Chloroflexota bacterium]HEV8054389.1 DUF4287 domain-containing protein [Candidatus Limnocylindrales bacterium]
MKATAHAEQVRDPSKPKPKAKQKQMPSAGEARASGSGVQRATGRVRAEWFSLLDAWGAAGRQYRQIADWLTSEHGLSNWWAQKLIVEYEQARGLRDPGVRPDGTFEVGASKTVAVPVERLVAAFVDAGLRGRWLPGAVLHERGSQAERTLRFDWGDGTTRIVVSFSATGKAKTQVVLQHQHLPDASSGEEMKAYWRERLTALKTLLEEAQTKES